MSYFKSESKNKFDYNLRLSAWGIWFGFRVYIEPYDNQRYNRTKIIDGLWINVCDSQISASEKELIVSGLKMVAKEIIEKSPYSNNTLLIICDFDVATCDYQEEGLKDAMVKWAELALDIQIPETTITFNKKLNKYEFSYKL